MVGLIWMNLGSLKYIVSPPNTRTSAPEIHNIGEIRPSLIFETISAAIVASTNDAVARMTRAITTAPSLSTPSRNGVAHATIRIATTAGNRNLTAKNTRSEEHTSELQSLMRTTYAVFYLKTKNHNATQIHYNKNNKK